MCCVYVIVPNQPLSYASADVCTVQFACLSVALSGSKLVEQYGESAGGSLPASTSRLTGMLIGDSALMLMGVTDTRDRVGHTAVLSERASCDFKFPPPAAKRSRPPTNTRLSRKCAFGPISKMSARSTVRQIQRNVATSLITTAEISQAVEKLQKRCIVKFTENEMHIICNNDAGEGSIQVWSCVRFPRPAHTPVTDTPRRAQTDQGAVVVHRVPHTVERGQ